MKKFRMKLTLVFVLFMGCTVVGLGIFTGQLLKQNHIDTLRESVLREIGLISAMVSWQTDKPLQERIDYFEVMADELQPITGSRITFIDYDGTVLGDSDYDARRMDNHADREEIREAQQHQDGIGFSIRYSDTVKRDILNVAVEMELESGQIGYIRLGTDLSKVEGAVRKLWSYYLTGFLLLFVLAALISFRIARGLTRPLEHITGVAEQISRARYDSRVRIHNRDEIGKLGKAINAMADSLQSQMNRIADNERRLQTVLESLVTGVIMIDRHGRIALMNQMAVSILGLAGTDSMGKHYTEAGIRQRELLDLVAECEQERERIRDENTFYYPEERTLEINLVPLGQRQDEWRGLVIVLHDITAIRRLERMRSEFVANVSHELKTPIASVKGFAETLLSGALKDEEAAEDFVRIIYDESERLNRLIIDILELSRIESKQIPLNMAPIEMRSLVEHSVRTLHSEARKKQIDMHVDVAAGLYVEADEDKLRQVLINLLSNAVHYTSEGGKVTVEVFALHLSDDPAEDKIRIRISDTGMGIPKKDLPRIFERFYRVDKARSRRSGGTGLGLSIVKHIVELHHGEIDVESEPGIGTTFMIDLPVIQ